ncbi:hypothetical protein CYMTET_33537 [Cymbomonas tetramitiformis]|uniref:Uncharacterized protein n=1 Tax=Cymbomonas tetramitiformis TaxID=36881 RepID=A0AAE0KQU8_9CHLO|nr:hypothetical protein CYMTET_33537 [Cymbomonas tetramitiformis]
MPEQDVTWAQMGSLNVTACAFKNSSIASTVYSIADLIPRGIPGADVRVSAGGDSAVFLAPMSGSRGGGSGSWRRCLGLAGGGSAIFLRLRRCPGLWAGGDSAIFPPRCLGLGWGGSAVFLAPMSGSRLAVTARYSRRRCPGLGWRWQRGIPGTMSGSWP